MDLFIGECWQMLISRLAFPPDKKAGSGTDPVLVTLTDEEPKVGCEGSCCSQPSCAHLIAKWKETEGGGGSPGAAGRRGWQAPGLCRRSLRRWGLAPFLLGATRMCAQISAPLCNAPARVRSEEREAEFNDVGEFGLVLMNTTCRQGQGELLRCALERGAGNRAALQENPSHRFPGGQVQVG